MEFEPGTFKLLRVRSPALSGNFQRVFVEVIENIPSIR